jgi:23S rRNA (guanine745-N1)-methyltransferase
MSAPILLCTVRTCHQPLSREERRYVCVNGHAFDIARSGYVNLLQPQDRRSLSPGDTPDAAAARRRFLDRGFASPLVDAIVAAADPRPGDALLDVGCGEGHHLAAFGQGPELILCGIDISVPAIDLAARRDPDSLWIVANADRFLPWPDASFDLVTSITARMNPAEFRRVLRPGGRALIALPGADDLIELREAILGDAVERDRSGRTIELFERDFSLEGLERIRHSATLDPEAIADVLSSSYRGLRTRERTRVATLGEMRVTLSRDILLFRPLPPRQP